MKHSSPPKKEALAAIGALSERADWEDIFHELHVRRKIQAGIAAADAGRTVPHEEVKRRFLRAP